MQQDLRVAAVQVCGCQEVRTDHLQTATRTQHPRRRLDRLLNDRDLALVDLEVDQLRRLLRQPASLVQPGCTIEPLAVLGENVKSGLRQAPCAAEPETV